MGMYDTIEVHPKWLPSDLIITENSTEFQTKSLECLLNNYLIDEDGSLLITFPDVKSEEFIRDCYTGEIRFYMRDENRVFWDFKALCVEGLVKEVILFDKYKL